MIKTGLPNDPKRTGHHLEWSIQYAKTEGEACMSDVSCLPNGLVVSLVRPDPS